MAQPLGKTDSSSASEDVSAASPLASWLSHLGLPRSSATQYAVLLGDAGLDPRTTPVTDEQLATLDGLHNPVHRRRIALASSRAEPQPAAAGMRRSARSCFDLKGGPGTGSALAHACDTLRGVSLSEPALNELHLETISAWTSERAPLSPEVLNEGNGDGDAAGFSVLAMPVFARVRTIPEGPYGQRPSTSTPALSRRPTMSAEDEALGHVSPLAERCGHAAKARVYYEIVGDQYMPLVDELCAQGRNPLHVQLPRDEAFCSVRRNVKMPAGSHAFVVVPGEEHLRMTMHAAPFGTASGHPQLADERPVLYAGELLLNEHARLLAWSNVSGTYTPPRELAAQLDLPLELFWSLMVAEEALRELAAHEHGAGAARGAEAAAGACGPVLSIRHLDARFGIGNHLRLPSGDILVRDIARCAASERPPLPPGSWWPVQLDATGFVPPAARGTDKGMLVPGTLHTSPPTNLRATELYGKPGSR